MHGNLSGAGVGAIVSSPGSGTGLVPEAGANPGSGTDDWFYQCAIDVFGRKETGQLLHLATDWPRTSCYAFVAKNPLERRKPNPEFLRVLFRSDHGRPFFHAFMHGSKAAWWLDCERDAAVAAAARRFAKQLETRP